MSLKVLTLQFSAQVVGFVVQVDVACCCPTVVMCCVGCPGCVGLLLSGGLDGLGVECAYGCTLVIMLMSCSLVTGDDVLES